MKNLILLLSFPYLLNAVLQTVHSKITVLCDGNPVKNVQVALKMHDNSGDPDELLETKWTDSNGEHTFSTDEDQTAPIEPYFKIEHMCNSKMYTNDFIEISPDMYCTVLVDLGKEVGDEVTSCTFETKQQIE